MNRMDELVSLRYLGDIMDPCGKHGVLVNGCYYHFDPDGEVHGANVATLLSGVKGPFRELNKEEQIERAKLLAKRLEAIESDGQEYVPTRTNIDRAKKKTAQPKKAITAKAIDPAEAVTA